MGGLDHWLSLATTPRLAIRTVVFVTALWHCGASCPTVPRIRDDACHATSPCESDTLSMVQSVKPQRVKEINGSHEPGIPGHQSANSTLQMTARSALPPPQSHGENVSKGPQAPGTAPSNLALLLTAARGTLQQMVRPSATFVFVGPFLIMTFILIACFAALFTFSADCRTFQPSEDGSPTPTWPRSSTRPRSQRSALTPASRHTLSQDPYLQFNRASEASLPPKAALPSAAGPQQSILSAAGSQSQAGSSRKVPSLRLSSISAPAATGRLSGGLPVATAAPLQPLFPALVLPAREGQLEMSLDALQTVQKTGAGRFFVIGPLGNKVFHVTACGSAFDVHMAQRSSELVSKVSLRDFPDGQRIDICRGDGSIYGKIVEHEQPSESGEEVSFSVIVTSSSGKAERAMLVIQGHPESFRLAAKAASDGQAVASATPQKYDEEHLLDLRTSRGADTALIVSSFLGILLLRDRPRTSNVPRPLMSGA